MIDGEVPRLNFDSLLWACVSIFTVLIGDDWNSIMYTCMRAFGWYTSIYFIALVLLGNIIMLNLFLAILLGNFDRARHYWMKRKIFDAFYKQIIQRQQPLLDAIDYILGDMASHVKEKVLRPERPAPGLSAE